jgi:rhodanese-related sulfurtransferase
MNLNFLTTIKDLNKRIDGLEKKVDYLENSLSSESHLISSFFLRLITQSPLTEHMILSKRPYFDLNPKDALNLIAQDNLAYQLIDVSDKAFIPPSQYKKRIHIPLSELGGHLDQLPPKKMPLLIICEDGTKSILACEILAKLGYFHISNISGGFACLK